MITDKQNAERPFLDIADTRHNLGHEIVSGLPVLHTNSESDIICNLFGIGKSTVMKKISFSRGNKPFYFSKCKS